VTIWAFDVARRTNAHAIVDAHRLGFVEGEVLDLTVGPKARFWTRYRPELLVTNDLSAAVEADLHVDATRTGIPDGWCDTVVFDPPYGYRGTSRLPMDDDYGIGGEYMPSNVIDALLYRGTLEACRVARRNVLAKCQDSSVASAYHHQTGIVARAAADAGWKVAAQLHVYGTRAQPAGKVQRNVWVNYSTLLALVPVRSRYRRRIVA
jgi:hypothetical protein